MKIQVNFVLERTTKGAFRYQEVSLLGVAMGFMDPNTVVGTLYIRKNGVKGFGPKNLTILITDETKD